MRTPSARWISPATCPSFSAPTVRASAVSSAPPPFATTSYGRSASSGRATWCASGATARRTPFSASAPGVVCRADGDRSLLVEYGPNVLDLNLRFRVHALEVATARRRPAGHHRPHSRRAIAADPLRHRATSIAKRCSMRWTTCERQIPDLDDISAPSRIVHLPLSWDDPATLLAIRKYMQSVRPDAPWCPSNIEFIRRINGLASVDDVQRIVFDANYLVLGLGDVYLGAPVATPVDPRHRLVTTKYNPARTWTPENAVGIGGAYMCVYGMEGPGGYQFVGRTLQMWNTFHALAAVAAALLRSDSVLRSQRERAAGNSRRLSARRLPAAHRGEGVPPEGLPRVPGLHTVRVRGIQGPAAGGIRGRARTLGAGRRGPVRGGDDDDAVAACRWTACRTVAVRSVRR